MDVTLISDFLSSFFSTTGFSDGFFSSLGLASLVILAAGFFFYSSDGFLSLGFSTLEAGGFLVSSGFLTSTAAAAGFFSFAGGFNCGLVGAAVVFDPTTAEMEPPALVLSASDLAMGSSASPSSFEAAAGTGFFPGWTRVGLVGAYFFSSSAF